MTYENDTFYRIEESPEASPFELSIINKPKSTKIHSGSDGRLNISFCYNFWLIIIWNVEITLILVIS